MEQPVCLWPVGAELGEGPLWHAASESVYFVDIRGRRLHRCAPDGTQRQSWDAPGRPGFIVPAVTVLSTDGGSGNDGDGFIVGLDDGLHQFNPASGAFSLLRAIEADQPGNRFNDGFIAADGSLWFGSMDAGETDPTGALYSLHPGGRLSTVDSGYIITNGPAMSPDGTTLYHTDTLGKKIHAFDVAPDGTATRKRLFIATAAPGHPDGMAVDADGNLWVAMFRGARIDRYNPAGQLTGTIAFPVSNITKLAFGGPDLRAAFVTTAWKGLSMDERAREPLAGALFTFRTGTPGLPQHTFSQQDIA
ncbi:SMP-30/gluconolactonase/LRE family protein [Massilia sp. CCM 8733]|uniref:SMP-30/gluconolactonase/LRE family protein n=1 Tax=Massilia mucilaginosa TaxID=2609282 RepID=A0ABX0NV98_9BURK|nr:SMP-30/gluconolactonase/LRE family protein [Massilia mucilaginosa]NHZ90760.1 SMP-30/gluconolactonase/LRE family protein [Massilia mucilaginosa]